MISKLTDVFYFSNLMCFLFTSFHIQCPVCVINRFVPRFKKGTNRDQHTYWSRSSSRHFLRFLSNNFKKQSRNLCFTPLLACMSHNDLPTKWIFIKESARWSGIHYYDVAIFNRKWPQQKQFSPTFRNIVFCEAKASKGKKKDILEN